jgi:hypothetical protein
MGGTSPAPQDRAGETRHRSPLPVASSSFRRTRTVGAVTPATSPTVARTTGAACPPATAYTHTHTAATPVGECPFATPVSTARSASRRASRSTSRPSPSRTGERSAPNGRSAAVTEAAVPCRATVRRRRGTCLLLRPVAHRRGVRQAVHPDRPPGAGVRNSTNGGPSTVGCYRTPDGSVRTDGGMRDDSWNGRRRWRR